MLRVQSTSMSTYHNGVRDCCYEGQRRHFCTSFTASARLLRTGTHQHRLRRQRLFICKPIAAMPLPTLVKTGTWIWDLGYCPASLVFVVPYWYSSQLDLRRGFAANLVILDVGLRWLLLIVFQCHSRRISNRLTVYTAFHIRTPGSTPA